LIPQRTGSRRTGAGYDANGNLTGYGTGGFAATYAYDIENRLGSATVSGTTYGYAYDSSNQRVFSATLSGSSYTNELIYFYGADGKKLGVWSLTASTIQNISVNQWFAGRLLKGQDRLQSVGKYFPYGEDRYGPNPANPANDQEKFATYTRDSSSGLDYAMNRYYNSLIGRFQTPDPYQPSAKQSSPQSWNRYAYVENDPANALDPTGLFLLAHQADGNGGPDGLGGGGGGYGWFYGALFYGTSWPVPPESPILSGGGGGGASFRITVSALSKTGPHEIQIINALKKFESNISTDCANWLSSGKGKSIVTSVPSRLILYNGVPSRG
jgi:RHS repeat-associated protein